MSKAINVFLITYNATGLTVEDILKKEAIKKRIAGKNLGEGAAEVETRDRSFYVQNGYEYYPFQGEFWLDEIGNYHYLGKQSCE